jgi:lipid-A-disaccharide synthase
MGRTILIVTGEASGDLHGAELARALRHQEPGVRLLGMGGERMQQAGVELIFDNRELGVMGVVEVFGRWKSVLSAFGAIKGVLERKTVDLVVMIDSPDFNLRVARMAKRMGLSTVYYIGPKVWAWRSGRVRTIKKWVDRMLVIFPFEEKFYRDAGVPCEYVGNPLMDEIPGAQDRGAARRQFGLPAEGPVIALLPGSRRMEIDRLLRVMVEAFARIRAEFPTAAGVVPVAPSFSLNDLRREAGSGGEDSSGIRWISGEAPRVLACSDFAIVASGTATLEAAVVDTPMVIVYKVAPLTMLLARLLVKIRSAGLVNILAGRCVAPEFLQSDATPENVANAVLDYWRNPAKRQEQRKDLEEIRRILGGPGAARRAAAGVLKFLSQSNKTAAV